MHLAKNLPAIAFGCDPLGGHNWGEVDPASIMAAIPRAIERGVTLFDTADCYGDGLSEERLGLALSSRRHDCLIASKFGVRIGADGRTYIDNRPEWINQAIDASLQRLGTDYIDVYQLHWWDRTTPFADIFEALEKLVRLGKIRSYGTTNVTLEMMGLGKSEDLPPAFASSSMEFSLVQAGNRDAITRMCGSASGPAFLSWGSLGGGLLSGKYKSASDLDAKDRRLKRVDSHFTGERLQRNLKIVELCAEIANEHGDEIKTSQIALQWVRKTLGFGSCLVGIKNANQLDDAIGSLDFQLSDAALRRLDDIAGSSC